MSRVLLHWALLSVTALLSPVYADPLNHADDQSNTLVVSSPGNISSASNVSASNFNIQCDEMYGEYLNLRDCQSAASYIRPSNEEIRFMDRTDPTRPRSTMPLPYRLMGGALGVTLLMASELHM